MLIAETHVWRDRHSIDNIKALFQAFEDAFKHHLSRNFAVGSLGNHERVVALDYVVAHNHIAAHRQAVHKVAIVGKRHLFGGNGPAAVGAKHFSTK